MSIDLGASVYYINREFHKKANYKNEDLLSFAVGVFVTVAGVRALSAGFLKEAEPFIWDPKFLQNALNTMLATNGAKQFLAFYESHTDDIFINVRMSVKSAHDTTSEKAPPIFKLTMQAKKVTAKESDPYPWIVELSSPTCDFVHAKASEKN